MKTITVFTPTYNRAYLLPRLYQSLCNQSAKDFVWMIIDDGSTDDTKALVEIWIKEDKIEIQYHYKQNGGMHTGHNLAYSIIKTELNVCIDSDDYMPTDAVEKIVSIWNKTSHGSQLAGIIGLDAKENGDVIGTTMPTGITEGNLFDLYHKYKVWGDKKLVLKTEVVRQYPQYPEYEGEKLVPLGSLYLMIDQDYKMLYSDEVLCVVEYQPEGSSNSIFRQYKQSPRGFAYTKKLQKKYNNSFIDNLKNSAQIASFSLFAKDFSLLNDGPKVYQNYLMFPLGLLLNAFIRFKIK